MMEWIEILMQAALGIIDKKVPSLESFKSEASWTWLKFHALGMQCECCWEQVPEALKISGIELVRIDAGSEVVSIRPEEEAELEVIVDRVTSILQDRFGFLVTLLSQD